MTFQDLLIRIKDKGKDKSKSDFEESVRTVLNIFANGEHKEKVDLLLKAVNAGYFDKMREASEREKTIQTLELSELIRDFQNRNSVPRETAFETVSYLATLLGLEMPSIDAHRTTPSVKQLKNHEELEERINKVEHDINRLVNLDSRINTIEERLKNVERGIQNSTEELSTLNTINKWILNLDSRIKTIEESMRKSEFARPTQNQEKITSEIRKLTEQIQRIGENVDKTTRHLYSINARVKNLEDSVNRAEPVLPKRISDPPQSMSAIHNADTAVSDFNAWAAGPGTRLPNGFYYLEHDDMRIRREQPLTPSATETKWISNKNGSKKYLFPNPNFFDQMTDISDLYRMDLTKLRSKGQNKIKITKPCEMSDTGFINYPGELTLF